MSDFAPGVARARAAGHPITVAPYPLGAAGVTISLETIAKKIRDGRNDPDVRGWAGDVLIRAGRPKGRRARVSALLDAFRKVTLYLPDPVGTEMIAAAHVTVCLRPGLCMRARDCDDGCVFLGSAIMSIGIPVRVIKQNFGPGRQEHVLIEAEDDNGAWFPADPSTDLPCGSRVPAVSETRMDPMRGPDGQTVGAEIVTLGGIPARAIRAMGLGRVHEHGAHAHVPQGPRRRFVEGRWWDYGPDGARTLVVGASCGVWGTALAHPPPMLVATALSELAASGGQPASAVVDGTMYLFQLRAGGGPPVIRPCLVHGSLAGVGATAPTTTPWQTASLTAPVTPGLRYKWDFLVTSLGATSGIGSSTDPRIAAYAAASGDTSAQTQMLTALLRSQWSIESLTKTHAVSGGVDSWELVGIPILAFAVPNDAFFSSTALAAQASASPTTPAPSPGASPTAVTSPTSPFPGGSLPSIGTVAVGAAIAAVLGGIAWGLWEIEKSKAA
jgi:hypothetical protein